VSISGKFPFGGEEGRTSYPDPGMIVSMALGGEKT
jgi:hypothetical protein